VTLPFYKTATFFVCAVLLVVGIVLFIVIGKRADPYRKLPGGETRTPVEIAESADTKSTDPKHADPKAVLHEALEWDFGFIPVYVFTISLLCYIGGRFAADANLLPLRVTWIVIAIVIVGSLIDVCENVALLRIIHGSADRMAETIANLGKRLKFIIPVSATIYGVVTWVWGAIRLFRH
jgi:hypothetical protein